MHIFMAVRISRASGAVLFRAEAATLVQLCDGRPLLIDLRGFFHEGAAPQNSKIDYLSLRQRATGDIVSPLAAHQFSEAVLTSLVSVWCKLASTFGVISRLNFVGSGGSPQYSQKD